MDTTQNVYAAGDLVATSEFLLTLPPGRLPREDAVRGAVHERLLGGIALLREASAPDARQRAAQLCEEMQALHVLLRSAGYGTVRFRLDFRALCDSLLPVLGTDAARFIEVSQYVDIEHQQRVVAYASALGERLASVPTPEAGSTLSSTERTEMLSAFTGVQYAGGEVFLEPAFAHQMLKDWNKPLLTNTAHAVETLHMLHHLEEDIGRAAEGQAGARRDDVMRSAAPRAPERHRSRFVVKPGVLQFVESHYRSEGCFVDRKDPSQDLYATSSGIAVYKAAKDLDCSKQASAELLPELFPEPERYLRMREWALRRFCELLDREQGTLIEFNHAVRILWNLSADLPGGVGDLLRPYHDRLVAFLKRSERRVPGDDGAELVAFATAPSKKPACLTACLASARLAQHAKLRDDSLQRSLERCVDYVIACQTAGSGFGSSIRHVPDILHTYMAVAFLLERRRSAIEGELTSIVNFVRRCDKGGGYALVPEWKPTAYGTRLALQIFRRLDLTVPDREQMKAFIAHLSVRVERLGDSYIGYSRVPMLMRSDAPPPP